MNTLQTATMSQKLIFTVQEEESHKEAETEPLLQEKCTSSYSCYTECSCAQVTQSPSSPSASDDDGDDNNKTMTK